MLKNKIYNYLAGEIFKNFITILLTFTAIAWTVRAVNFLDLMIEDGFSVYIYFKYSLLNISTIVTRFVPLSFLLSMIISIAKFERQQELLILWTTGTNKIKIANIFFFIGFSIALLQIILGVIVNPLTLNKSRALLREADNIKINSVLKSGDFSDVFKGITFYIDKKSSSDELINIFIRDSNGSLSTAVGEINNSVNTTILAKKGTIVGDKLVLFNGKIQTIDEKKTIKNINFEKTELSIEQFSTRTITQPKIQETLSSELFNCLIGKFLQNCAFKKNKKIVIENLSRRVGMPLYIPLISVISSYLLIYKKNIKYNFIRKYIVFIFAFIILIAGEILLRFSGFSITNFVLYFFSPLILLIILYTILLKKTMSERV
jgi:lipopolysaccharide export system permease protein